MSDLRDIAPPPEQPPPEPKLGGRPLPADYERLAREYGPGCFDEFIWLLAPGAANENLDLDHQAQIRIKALRTLDEPLPYEPLLPFAFTDNGDVVYWHTAHDDPDRWTVVANESRGPEWFAFDGTATAFLATVLSGDTRVPFFPDDFPGPDPAFTP